ncbi:MAG TPA: YhcN/YlaJ family sporulation lipoprotein [Bacillales bacterium]
MNKAITLLTVTILATFGLSACSPGNNGMNPKNYQNQSYELSNRTEPDNAKNPRTQSDVEQGHFGFVRIQEGPDGKAPGEIPSLNFEEMADIISRLAVNYTDVHDVATLVTSKEVLIGYHTDTNNRDLAADQVKRTALSVVPGFYHVYVTDDPTLIKDIAEFRDLAPTRDIQQMLDATIREMKKQSPQGWNADDGKNPNNEEKRKMGANTR